MAEASHLRKLNRGGSHESGRHVTQVVEEELALAKLGRKQKLSERHHYTDDLCTAIGKHAMQYGNKSAVAKFSESLGFCIPAATVHNFK